VIGILQDAASFAASLAQWGLSLAALVAAVLAWGARFHPMARGPVPELLVLAFGATLVVAAWNGSALHHDRLQDLEQAQTDLKRWKEAWAEQVRQREELEKIADVQRRLARDRAADLAKSQEIIDGYNEAVAAGDSVSCPPDDAYRRTMRSIPIVGSRATEAAGAGTRPGNAVPRSRP
jgi:hypothetical protein